MTGSRQVFTLTLAVVFIAAALMGGCGGGGGGNQFLVTVLWGSGQAVRSARAALFAGTTQVGGTLIIDRVGVETERSAAIGGMAPGSYMLEVRIFDQPNGVGALLGIVAIPVTVTPGASPSATVAVGATPTVLNVSPPSVNLVAGQTVQFTATPRDAGGNAVPVAAGSISWDSDNPAAASVSASGLVTAVAGGNATITASHGGSGLTGDSAVVVRFVTEWTVMVFLNGANDLDEFGPLNVNQMEAGMSGQSVRMVAQWKRIARYAVVQPWVGTRRYLIAPDSNMGVVASTLVETMPDATDMGSWQNLRSFVEWSKASYPANRYALVIWNHGNGVLRSRRPSVTRDVSYDDGTGNAIGVSELDDALAGENVDLLVMDASLMQMVEVAWQVRTACDYLVGSEQSPPGEGYPYHLIVGDLCANPAMDTPEFGRVWVNRTVPYYVGRNFTGITQSLVALSSLQPIVSALNSFADLLIAKSPQYASEYAIVGNQASRRYKARPFRDLTDLATQFGIVTGDAQITASAALVQAAVANAVLEEGHSQDMSFSTGLSVYYPHGGSYLSYYDQLTFPAAVPRWKQFIQTAP